MNPSPPPLPPEQPKQKESGFPDPRFFCYFIIGFVGFKFMTDPVKNQAQLLFRLVVMIAAIAGLVILEVRKRKSRS